MSTSRTRGKQTRLGGWFSAFARLGRIRATASEAKSKVLASELRLDSVEDALRHIGPDLASALDQIRDMRGEITHATDIAHAVSDLHAAQDTLLQRVRALETDLEAEIAAQMRAMDTLRDAERSERQEALRTVRSETALLGRVFADLSRRFDRVTLEAGGVAQDVAPSAPLSAPAQVPASDGFEMFKDAFYHALENRYRGSEDEITRRLRIYLPDVEAAWTRTGQKPAMDLGCGRGEWLGLLAEAGITGFGVDTNAVQIDDAKSRGLDVRLGDALQALADQPDASLSLISAHHLIEHLPFDAVVWITREAQRVLAPGGLLLFETPNTRNVLVGATTFHTDPTHLKPMPEQVMRVLFDTAGFDPLEIRHLNPHERMSEFLSKPDMNDEMAFLMFGPQDLAVLGTKPVKKD